MLRQAPERMVQYLWNYLNEELATMPLFHENVSVTVKRKIVQALKNRKTSVITNQRYYVLENNLGLLLE